MAQSTPIRRNANTALQAEFECEIARLIEDGQSRAPAEAVLRIRVLADLADALSTEALIELGAIASVTRAASPKAGREQRPRRGVAGSSTLGGVAVSRTTGDRESLDLGGKLVG